MASALRRIVCDRASRIGGWSLAPGGCAGVALRTLARRFAPGRRPLARPGAAAWVAALLIGLAAAPAADADGSATDGSARYVKPGSRAAGLAQCVEPTGYMRRHHMDLIQHQRDATVHGGIRGTRHSLSGCIDCHVSAGPDGRVVAVNAEHQFCNACHQFAAVKVNCFDCHASVPKGAPLSDAALAAARAAAGAQPAAAGGTGQ